MLGGWVFFGQIRVDSIETVDLLVLFVSPAVMMLLEVDGAGKIFDAILEILLDKQVKTSTLVYAFSDNGACVL